MSNPTTNLARRLDALDAQAGECPAELDPHWRQRKEPERQRSKATMHAYLDGRHDDLASVTRTRPEVVQAMLDYRDGKIKLDPQDAAYSRFVDANSRLAFVDHAT